MNQNQYPAPQHPHPPSNYAAHESSSGTGNLSFNTPMRATQLPPAHRSAPQLQQSSQMQRSQSTASGPRSSAGSGSGSYSGSFSGSPDGQRSAKRIRSNENSQPHGDRSSQTQSHSHSQSGLPNRPARGRISHREPSSSPGPEESAQVEQLLCQLDVYHPLSLGKRRPATDLPQDFLERLRPQLRQYLCSDGTTALTGNLKIRDFHCVRTKLYKGMPPSPATKTHHITDTY